MLLNASNCARGKTTVILIFIMFMAVAMRAAAKEIIGYGWEFLAATTEDVHRNRAKFADTGLAGVIMRIDGRDESGLAFSSRNILNAERKWNNADFRETIGMLRDISSSEGLSQSMGLLLLTPKKRIDWRDDASWERAATNLAVLGEVLKTGGFKGIALDHEDYGRTRQFQTTPADPEFPEFAEIVRRRGRQMFAPFFRAFPDARVLGFWMLSSTSDAVWRDFLNGMLDAMPSTARFVDGNEDSGYQADALRGDFLRWAWNTIRDLEGFVPPENLSKYRQCVSVSFGQYIDSYLVPTNNAYYIGPNKGGTRVGKFEENLSDAVRFCDDLVWLYGEKGTFIDWDRKDEPKMASRTWEERLPGFRRAVRIASGDGMSVVREAEDGMLTNLLKNGGCDLPTGKTVCQAFDTWVKFGDIPNEELFTYDAKSGCAKPGCIKLIGKTGCYTFGCGGLRSGESLYLRYAVKDLLGTSRSSGAWSRCGKKFWYSDRRYLRPGRDLGGGWREVFERFTVPDGMDGFFFSVSGHASKDYPLAFDDIGLYVSR